MQSGCPHSQRGTYSAFQHRGNFGAPPSPQDITVTPVPVVHSESGIQSNMVATEYSGNLRVAHSPAQLQQGYAQSQQNFQGLHYQQEIQASIVSTGYQHPIPRDSARTSWNSRHQTSREGRADLYSSTHVSAQHSGWAGILATKNSVRQSVYNSGQQWEWSKQTFSRDFQKGSKLDNSAQQQRQPLNCASSAGTNSVALQQDLLVGTKQPPTDAEIYDFIEKQVEICLGLTPKNRNYGHSNKQWDLPEVNSVAHLPTTSASNKKDVERQSLSSTVTEEYTAAVGQALEEDSSKSSKENAELTPRCKETSASKKHSTENPQVMKTGIATWIKNGAVPGRTWDELTEKQTSSMLNRSSSQEEYGSLRLNRKDLDDIDKVPDVKEGHMPEGEKEDTALKPVEAVWLDSMQGVTDVSEGLRTKSSSVVSENKTFELTSVIENQDANTKNKKNTDDQQQCCVTCKEAIAHSGLNSSDDKIQVHNIVSVPTNQTEWLSRQTSLEVVRKDAGSVHSPTDLSIALSENKVNNHVILSESTLQVYEDISDDDTSQLATNVPSTAYEKLSLYFEDVSENESPQVEYMVVETSSPTQVPEPNDKQSPFEENGHGHEQGQAQMKTEIIPDEEWIQKTQDSPKTETLDIAQDCSSPSFDEADEGLLYPKCDSERNYSAACSPSSVLKDDETDDEMDDDWLVIPIKISDLRFEPEEEDHDILEKTGLDGGETEDQERQCDSSPTHWPSPKPALASAFPPLQEYETLANFKEVMAWKLKTEVSEVESCKSTSDHERQFEEEPRTPQNRSESVDSCETEDSCDYSPVLERNYMTVSRKLSARLHSETDVSVSAKEGERYEVTDMQKDQARFLNNLSVMQKLREYVQPKTNGQKISILDEIIISSSDTEDESDQNCKKKAKRKRFFSSSSEDSEGAPYYQRRRHSPETRDSQCGTVEERFQRNSLSSVDSPAPSERHDETKAASAHVQHKTNRQKISENVIIIDSDTEDDSDQNYKKPSRKRISSSESDSGEAPCVERKRRSLETVNSEFGTAKEKLQETRLSPADSSLPQHQSKRHDTQFKAVMENACSDLSHSSKKSGQLSEGGSEHVPHKTNRRTTSKRREVFDDSAKVVKKSHFSKKMAKTKRIFSSGSNDSGDDLFTRKNRPSSETVDRLRGTANKQPQKNRLSSDDSPEKLSQSVDTEANSTLGPNPVIPRFVVMKSSQPSKNLKLLESRFHKQSKDGTRSLKTSTASSNKTDPCEMNKWHLYRNEKGRFAPKPNPAKERRHSTENNVQASGPKSRMVSSQLFLLGQEGPRTSDSLTSISGPRSEARQSSASRDLSQSAATSTSSSRLTSQQSTSIPRHWPSSKRQRSHSDSNPSTLNHPYTATNGPSSFAIMQSSARIQVAQERNNRRRTSLEDLRNMNGLLREARPGLSHHVRAPRQKHNSRKPATPPLMKKTRIAARQWTKDINRDPPREPSSVGEGYKWKEASGDKASKRDGQKCRSPPRPHQGE